MKKIPPIAATDLYLNDVEIAWLAGLFEGEGTFGIDERSVTRYESSTSPAVPIFSISMTDEDVIAKVARMLRKDYFSPKRKTVTEKQVYTVSTQSRPILTYLLPLVLPHLGKRRAAEVEKQIDLLDKHKIWYEEGGRSTQAKRGYKAGLGVNKKV